MDPSDMLQEILEMLDANGCYQEQRDHLLYFCVQGNEHSENLVHWDRKMCKLPRLPLSGIRFKRISETFIVFKNIASKIANELKL
ncbi:MAP/microtubule affinity-regulating kinase 3 [Sciurus carolinensis]|uniref:non-specific serine/threonine protein kinase n=1 Tax=Sciurus carolinensis TaxID=30640 RepID=A0AA41MPQ2_SCICA|nr:MAP/microtubule affinity-regulating kinase 3 [Sciurus carolinensis]